MLRFLALWFLVRVGGRIAPNPLYALSEVFSTVAWYGSRRLRATMRAHMRHVLGEAAARREVERAARGCVRNAGYYYADFARYTRVTPERAFAEIESIEGIDQMYGAYDRGCGMLLVSAHLGNPEFISQALGPFGLDLAVITEPLAPPRVHRFVHSVRSRAGVRYMPADRSGLRGALRHLRNGGTLGMLIDRDVTGKGELFEFFGEEARLPSGAVHLARRTGAPIVLGLVLRTGPARYRIALERVPLPEPTVDRDADEAAGMRALIAALEAGIRRAPEQWFVLRPVWPSSPVRRREPLRVRG